MLQGISNLDNYYRTNKVKGGHKNNFSSMKWTLVGLLTFVHILVSVGYEITLDTQKDSRYWKIQGNYFYAQSIADGSKLAPQLKSDETPGTTKGVWYFKHAPFSIDNNNYFEMYYALTHQLMYQVHLRMLADPSVAVVVKNGQDETIGSFWSNGTKWCDALLTQRLSAQIKIGVNLTRPNTYVMIDKVVLGIAGNISSLNTTNFNPCFTTPGNLSSSPNPGNDPFEHDLFSKSATTVSVSTTTTTEKSVSTNHISKVGLSTSLDSNEDGTNNSSLHNSQNIIIPTTTMADNSNMNCQCSCGVKRSD